MSMVDAGQKVKIPKHRSRTHDTNFDHASNRARRTARLQTIADAIHRNGCKRPTAKAGAGFRKSPRKRVGQSRQSHEAVRHATKPGSPKQRHLTGSASRIRWPALKLKSKVSVFGTAATVRNRPRVASLQNYSPLEDYKGIAKRRMKTRSDRVLTRRSENARDSCRQASWASVRARSRSRRFSGCDTWRPTPCPSCAPACAGS